VRCGIGNSVVALVRKRNGAVWEGSRFATARVYCERVHKRFPVIVPEESAMRLTLLTTLVAFGVVACGGEKKSSASQAEAATPAPAVTPAAPAATPAAPAATRATPAAAVVEVKMTGDGTTKAAFEPATLTIKPGTTVRFINVSGGPHNVAFYADSIPKGAADVLKKGMPNPMGDLVGPFLMQPNEKYEVAFTGAPVGTYRAYCMPHIAFGMHMTITVK
jgi:plastocyanin